MTMNLTQHFFKRTLSATDAQVEAVRTEPFALNVIFNGVATQLTCSENSTSGKMMCASRNILRTITEANGRVVRCDTKPFHIALQ
jgi:hypothetical protein